MKLTSYNASFLDKHVTKKRLTRHDSKEKVIHIIDEIHVELQSGHQMFTVYGV